MNNLGVSTNELSIDQVLDFGLNRVEVCLGRSGSYKKRLNKLIKDIELSEKHEISYSIHLPVYLYEWFNHDYLAAFFLDKKHEKREMSFKLLKRNLDKLRKYNPDFYVLHFPGINFDKHDQSDRILKDSLERINKMAIEYDVKILLEYFGSNKNFFEYNQWIKIVPEYSNLGILLDTGHLYFSSILHDFNFYDAFDNLIDHADAFHIWTTKGNLPYKRNKYYKQYHHIPINIEQEQKDGWAFDTKKIIKKIKEKDKPVIIEASDYYRGRGYI